MDELLEQLKKWCKTFESTVGYQKYDSNVFDALNKRYVESKELIHKHAPQIYYWETTEYHHTNEVTMQDYLDNHLGEDCEVIMVDGTYAEIKKDGKKYEIHASGNGSSFSHKVEIKEI